MKKLLILFTLVTSFAQSSNVVQSIRLTFTDEVGVTNNTSINLDADEAQGFFLAFLKDKLVAQQATNLVPTFQNSIRGTTRDLLLKPLAAQAKADDWKTNKLDLLFVYGPLLRNSNIFTGAQITTLKSVVNAPNVLTNLPAQ
jgi:hypothetical protein